MKYATLMVSVLILIAVLIPGSDLPEVNMTGFDKLVHLGLFGLWALAFRYDFESAGSKLLVVFTTGISFSLFTEILQLFVEGRSFDMFDVLADAVGLITGFVASKKIIPLIRRRG